MGRNTKYKSDSLCIAIFTLCLAARFVEYFLIETDRTAIGENVLHKAAGIIILALALKRVNLTWSDIGFQRNGFVSSILKGLLLGSVCFIISLVRIGNFNFARQPCTLRNIYRQFFFNRLWDKKYGFCFLSVMCSIQCD